MLDRTPPQFRELHEITMQTDTRDILAHATRQALPHPPETMQRRLSRQLSTEKFSPYTSTT